MKAKILLTLCALLLVGKATAQDWHLSYNYTYYAPVGLQLGYMPANFGGYVSGKFGISGLESGANRYKIDQIVGTNGLEKHGNGRNSYTAGIMLGLSKYIALYGGAGYGTYGERWGERDAESASLSIKEFAGHEAELGLMYRGEEMVFGLGCVAMKGTNVTRKAILVDVSVTIGLRF